MFQTDRYEGLMAETVMMSGAHGDWINAYFARPLGAGPFPVMVLAHHMPGWDEWYRAATLKFALHGYVTITPNLYFRAGHGTPEDVAAKVRDTLASHPLRSAEMQYKHETGCRFRLRREDDPAKEQIITAITFAVPESDPPSKTKRSRK